MPRRYAAESPAAPEAAWSLMAVPARWHEWAPHLRGAWGLGAPEVREHALGAARLLWVVPVPARVTRKAPGRSWTWRVGPVRLDHAVEPLAGGGCRVVVTLSAPPPVEALVAATYGPLVQALVDNLARVAARERPTRRDGGQ